MNVVQKTKERAQLMLQAVERAEKLGQEDFKGILESLTYGGWAEKIIPKWYPHQYRLKPQKRNMTYKELEKELIHGNGFAVRDIEHPCLVTGFNEEDQEIKCVFCDNTIGWYTVETFCSDFTRPDGTKFEKED